MSATHLLVQTSCPDAEVAAEIGRRLVEARLAACATALPGARSVYRWAGQVEEATETVLLLKTTTACWEALAARLRELHPYELPEVLAVPVAVADPGFLQWIDRCVDPPA